MYRAKRYRVTLSRRRSIRENMRVQLWRGAHPARDRERLVGNSAARSGAGVEGARLGVSRVPRADGGALRRREGPGADVVLVISFEDEWRINDESFRSFVAGLCDKQVTTEHSGRSWGIQVDLAPPTAHGMLGLPMDALAGRTVPLEVVFGDRLLAAPRRCPRRGSVGLRLLRQSHLINDFRAITGRTPETFLQDAVTPAVDVEDVDAHCERARAAGAEIADEPEDQPYGERRYHARLQVIIRATANEA